MEKVIGNKVLTILLAASLFLACGTAVSASETDMAGVPAAEEVLADEGLTAIPEESKEQVSETPVITDPAEAAVEVEQPTETEPESMVPEEAAAEPAVEVPEVTAAVAPEEPEAEAAEEQNVKIPAEEEEAAEAAEEEELLEAEEGTPHIEYKTHVQTYGWQDYVKDGVMSGTSGKAKRLEGIQIKVSGIEGLGVEYRTHVQTIGWQNYVSQDQLAGTTGQSKRLEAIQIRLTGEAASDYDVYYCVHVQTYGWLNWAKNDEIAGTAGYAKRLEGICIKVQKKGETAPAPLGTRSVAALYGSIAYETHVQSYGWQGFVKDGAISGTTGQAKRLEGIRIHFDNPSLSGFVQYRTHIQGIGWEEGWRGPDMISGTTGQSKRLEAIQIRLYGAIAEEYDIWYRTHVQKYGWSGWTRNGTSCGSEGIAYRLEGIQIKLLPKGSPAPGSTENFFFTKPVEEVITDEITLMARDYVNRITDASMTKEQKLRIAFDSFRYTRELNPFGAVYTGYDWPQKYSRYFFTTETGDCIAFAVAFAYMAKAIGYTNVYAINSTGHGWAEINGLIYDPEWSLHSSPEYYAAPYSFVPHYQAVLNYANAENGLRQKI